MSLFDDASLVLTPNGYKASKLYSIKPTSGLGDMTVVRATTARRVNSAGLIESVAINVPRLDYTGGGCPKILIEPLRTNNVLRSQEFDNGYWNKSNVTVTANTTTAPDNTTTADNVNITTTNGFLRRTGLTFANSTSYTISIFVKKSATTGTKNFRFFYGNNAANTSGLTCTVDLTNITATTTTNGTVPPTILSTKLVNYVNNWYRVEVAFTTNALGGSSNSEIGLQPPSGGPVVDFDAWGAQVELGSTATSYIPTVAATVTRNADVISKTGISSLIGQTEGTIFVEANLTANTNERRIVVVSDGTETKRIMFWTLGTTLYANFNGVLVTIGTFPIGTAKMALAYTIGASSTTYSIKVNNNTLITGTAAAAPSSLSVIYLGTNTNSLLQLNDRIELATLFPTRLTNAQLATLTTL